MHPFTGPWQIVKSLPGASHELKFATCTARKSKKHASNLSPYSPELIPFQPVVGANNRYSQLYKAFEPSPYKEAGIKGFTPPQSFAVASHFARQGDFSDFHFPTLSKLNDEFEPFPWIDDNTRARF